MTANTDLILTVFDETGAPLAGLTPTWNLCTNLDTGLPVTPTPTVTGVGGGIYRVARLYAGHIVGQIDFGINAYPRYFTYEVFPNSGEVVFTSAGETVGPVIATVSAPRRTQLLVTFSKDVLMTTDVNGALYVANYSIPALTVTAVERVTSKQVLLTTTIQRANTQYNLTVYNVEDLSGNPISST